jgi:hypothetical protein
MAYRDPAGSARFVCTVCMRTASTTPGACPTCGVDRLPLDNPQVLEELRNRAEQQTQKKQARGWALVLGAAFVLAIAIYFVVGLALGIDLTPHESKARYSIVLVKPILFVPILFLVVVPLGIWHKRRHPDRDDIMTLGASELLRILRIAVDK